MNFTATLANTLWRASNIPALLRFRRDLRDPAAAQQQRLRSLLERNAHTAFGVAHGLAAIRSYEEFVRRVPLADYDDLAPWIERIRQGEPNVLTRDPVTHLVPTSGTSGARKLIPFTAGLQHEFNAAIGPWILDLMRQEPSLSRGPAYWAVTPVMRQNEDDFEVGRVAPRAPFERAAASSGAHGVTRPTVGFDSDSAYLGGARRRLVEAVMAVPPEVQHAATLEAFRYATLLCLLRCRELRLISVWHPSFLTLLLDELPSKWDWLLDDIKRGTCRLAEAFPLEARLQLSSNPMPARSRELASANPLQPASLWPELRVVSCWADGAAKLGAVHLRQRFPGALVQPKGLIATEAFVTLPFRGWHPLAVTSHFFEFLDRDGRVHLAESLREGEEYQVVVTTAGGLWRYRLGDRVVVDGRVDRTPSLRFLGRTGNVSDRFGEKLSEEFVTQAMQEVFADGPPPGFALLAPDEPGESCGYTLYVEGAVQAGWAAALDAALSRNPHYAYCRQLGQLRPIRVFAITREAYPVFVERMSAQGCRLGDIKPSCLSRLSGWSHHFPGGYVEESREVVSAG